MSSHLNPVYEYLHGITVGDLAKEVNMVVANAADDINEVVRKLTANHITSVPVVDAEGSCIGHVDSLDIVSHIVMVAPSEEDIMNGDEDRMAMFTRVIKMQQVEHILDASGRDPYVPLDTHQPVTTAMNLFAGGIHRCPIMSEDGTVISVLSQSEVLRHLTGCVDGEIDHTKRGHLGQFCKQTLGELGLNQTDDLVVVTETDTVWSALKKIRDANVSAIAVVDAEGKLCADLSASSLRGLVVDSFPSLLENIHDFLETHAKNATKPIIATGEDEFGAACKTMAENHVHRLWCVDADNKPVGVFSATDAMRTIAHVAFTPEP